MSRSLRRHRPGRRRLIFALLAVFIVHSTFTILVVFFPSATVAPPSTTGKPPSLGDLGAIATLCSTAMAGVVLLQLWTNPGRTRRVLERRRMRRAERAIAGVQELESPDAALDTMRGPWRDRVRAVKLKSVLEGLYATQASVPIGFTAGMCATAIGMMVLPQAIGLAIVPGPRSAFLSFIAPVFTWVFVIILYQIPRRIRTRARHAIESSVCPDCGYDLANLCLPDTQNPLGPSACPECGVGWPLVPPAPIALA